MTEQPRSYRNNVPDKEREREREREREERRVEQEGSRDPLVEKKKSPYFVY